VPLQMIDYSFDDPDGLSWSEFLKQVRKRVQVVNNLSSSDKQRLHDELQGVPWWAQHESDDA